MGNKALLYPASIMFFITTLPVLPSSLEAPTIAMDLGSNIASRLELMSSISKPFLRFNLMITNHGINVFYAFFVPHIMNKGSEILQILQFSLDNEIVFSSYFVYLFYILPKAQFTIYFSDTWNRLDLNTDEQDNICLQIPITSFFYELVMTMVSVLWTPRMLLIFSVSRVRRSAVSLDNISNTKSYLP